MNRPKKTLIMKFGGRSLATSSHFHHIADLILSQLNNWKHLVVVVSAMGNTTDALLALARKVSQNPPRREQDMLISAGERISMALLAMALADRGGQVISLTGSQAGIITSSCHSDAHIIDVRADRVMQSLQQGYIVIVAGFQGVSYHKEITTLGRGGSDTSAVALGVALGADKVEFYKDVEGIYEDDPKRNPSARLLSLLSYQEAIERSKHGYFALHHRAILLASQNHLPLHVLNFRRDKRNDFRGTWICDKKQERIIPPIYETSDMQEKVVPF